MARFEGRTFEEASPQRLIWHDCSELGNERLRRCNGLMRFF